MEPDNHNGYPGPEPLLSPLERSRSNKNPTDRGPERRKTSLALMWSAKWSPCDKKSVPCVELTAGQRKIKHTPTQQYSVIAAHKTLNTSGC